MKFSSNILFTVLLPFLFKVAVSTLNEGLETKDIDFTQNYTHNYDMLEIHNLNPENYLSRTKRILEEQTNKTSEYDPSFFGSVVKSLIMIFSVEFGDRSFMLIVLFSMRYDKWKVMIPAVISMMSLHLMSVAIGKGILLILPKIVVIYFSIALFIFFAILMFYDAYHMVPKSGDEKVQELKEQFEHDNEALTKEAEDKNDGKTVKHFFKSPYFQLIILLFLSDWGDRCQIGAIVLTATNNIWGVALGGAIGMGLCCILASFVGAIAANRISEKTTTIIGGCLFLFFAAQTTYAEILSG